MPNLEETGTANNETGRSDLMTGDRFDNETTAHGSTTSKEEVAVVRFEESSITFPYKRSLGPVIGAFMTALTEKKILGIRNGDGVLVPPMEWDPATGAELPRELIEVGPAGTIESWTWVTDPTQQHPLDRPFAFAFIRLDGASTPLLHAVDAGSPSAMVDGMRVAPRWKASGSATSLTSPASYPARSLKSRVMTWARPPSRWR